MTGRLLVLLLALVLSAGPALARPVLAIADLENHTGDPRYDPAGPGVAALLVTRFLRTEAVTVVERERLQAIVAELELGQSGLVDPATAARAGQLVGAEYLVLGSIFSVSLPQLSVSLRVVDTSTGDVVLSREVIGDVGEEGEDFFVLIDELAAGIVEGLDLELSARDKVELAQVDIRELEALLAYGRDLDRAPGDRPEALWRDKSRDMLDDWQRDRWVVFNNEGARFPAEAFAEAVGDTETLVAMAESRSSSRARRRIHSGVGWGLTAAGTAAMLLGTASWRVDDTQALVGGGSLAGLGLCWVWGANVQHARRMAVDQVPGTWWTPAEADALIERHNAGLE